MDANVLDAVRPVWGLHAHDKCARLDSPFLDLDSRSTQIISPAVMATLVTVKRCSGAGAGAVPLQLESRVVLFGRTRHKT
jgi:hypothetical protein